MSPVNPDEKRFEEFIEQELNSSNYSSRDFHEYDLNLCLIPEQVFDFIKTTNFPNL